MAKSVSKTRTMRGRGKVGSITNLKKALKRRSSSNIVRVKEEGITVRFQTEPDEWYEYLEHYDDTRGEGRSFYYPCTENDEGCQNGDSVSKRYLANAIDVDEKKAIALVLTQTAAEQVVKKYDRFKTILDREYFITRDGTGYDTKYDVTPEAPSKFNLSKYDLIPLEETLQAVLDEDEDVDDDKPKAKKGKPAAKSKPVTKSKKSKGLDDEDDRPVRKTRRPEPARKPAKKVMRKRK